MNDNNTKIIACACKHSYQDGKFGAGKRVANKCSDKGRFKGQHRCTVCSMVR